jgi:transcription elongation factor Elf1
MDAREIKRRIKAWKRRTPEQMADNEKIRKGFCPRCGHPLTLLSACPGGLPTITCQPCGGYFASVSKMASLGEQIETVKYFFRDLKNMAKIEERKKAELEGQHAEKLITPREVPETSGNHA